MTPQDLDERIRQVDEELAAIAARNAELDKLLGDSDQDKCLNPKTVKTVRNNMPRTNTRGIERPKIRFRKHRLKFIPEENLTDNE